MGFEIEEVASGKKILVATIPNWTRERSEELRDVIAESLPLGVAVVPDDLNWNMIDLPDLGGVTVWGGQDFDPFRFINREGLNVYEKDGLTYVEAAKDTKPDGAPKAEADECGSKKTTAGKMAEEKRAILNRLKKWREDHGPGCLDAVAKKAGKRFTPEFLRDMCHGGMKIPDQYWRLLDRALDKLEAEERKAAQNA
ncbi:MAG: hypothetical protein SOZ47_07275 [Lawsonibacter sp.]|nr:hypothetical protein [Lawsonibacter sp.]